MRAQHSDPCNPHAKVRPMKVGDDLVELSNEQRVQASLEKIDLAERHLETSFARKRVVQIYDSEVAREQQTCIQSLLVSV